MNDISSFSLNILDYLAFGAYFVVLCFIGFWGEIENKSEQIVDVFLCRVELCRLSAI